MKSDPKRRKKINGNDLQARGWGSQGQGRRAVLPDSIFSFSRMISDPFWGESYPPKGWSAADCSLMLSWLDVRSFGGFIVGALNIRSFALRLHTKNHG